MNYKEELTEKILSITQDYYHNLFVGAKVLGVALFVLSIAIMLILYLHTRAKLNIKNNIPYKVSKMPHYYIMGGIIIYVLALANTINKSPIRIAAYILLLILALTALYLLVTVRISALIVLFVFIWGSWIYLSAPLLHTTLYNFENIETSEVFLMFPMYIVGDYCITEILLVELFFAVITPIIVKYYLCYQRWVYKNGGSVKIEFTKSTLLDKIKDKIQGIKKSFIAILVIIVVFFIPLQNSLVTYLTEDDADANNTYLGYLSEYEDDQSVKADQNWMNDFSDAYETLKEINLRVFNINLRRVKFEDISFYTEYTYASYQQLLIIREQYEAVSSGDYEKLDETANNFDYTNTLKTKALANGLYKVLYGKVDLLSLALCWLITALQYYLSYGNLQVIGFVLLIPSALLVVDILVVMALNTKISNRYSIRDYICMAQREYVYKPPKIKEILGWVGIFVLTISVLAIINFIINKTQTKKAYEQIVTEAVYDSAIPLAQKLLSTDSLEALDKKETIELIDAQLDAVNALENYKDVDSEYTDTHEKILSMLPSLVNVLNEMKSKLQEGKAPDVDSIKQYYSIESSLLEETYNITFYKALTQAADLF